MNDPILIAFMTIEGLQMVVLGVLLYRSITKHVLDPLGLESRVARVEGRVLMVEQHQAEAARRFAEAERRLFERLESIGENNVRMVSHLTGMERTIGEEVKERREVSSRLDQLAIAISQVGSRFGALETSVHRILDARPQVPAGGKKSNG